MLTIYNSLTQQKEPFQPITPGLVNLYVCGPTVYDFVHLGNARSFTAFDMIVRYLRHSGFQVNYVRNITDIDDKIIRRANEAGEDCTAVTARFIKAFHEDMRTLGLLAPTHEPRATECVDGIIRLIETLIQAGKAYPAENGDVYYEVRRFERYGCLSHRNLDELESGARVEISAQKRDPLDFVLWKSWKPGEPAWDSPWGKGRPGWHIECSAMAMQLLGESFDLHGGGRDLIFPHHENEIAQSEGASGRPFAKVWLHAGYLQMDQEKMSKSLGNFLTVRDLMREHLPEVTRFFLLSSHYRSPLSYADDALTRARQSLARLYAAWADFPEVSLPTGHPYEERFLAAMDDDFNTPVAFSVLFDLAHDIQRLRAQQAEDAALLAALLRMLGRILGLFETAPELLLQGKVEDSDAKRIEQLIAARNAARAAKNWAEADRIRDELLRDSIALEDNAEGTRWRKTK